MRVSFVDWAGALMTSRKIKRKNGTKRSKYFGLSCKNSFRTEKLKDENTEKSKGSKIIQESKVDLRLPEIEFQIAPFPDGQCEVEYPNFGFKGQP